MVMNRAIAVILLLAACAADRSAAAAAGIGDKIANFDLQDTAGNRHALSSYSGKVVVLAFWSYKCPTALAYNDRIAALQARNGSRGVVVLAVASNTNETGTEIQRNAANLGLTFPILLDTDAVLADRLGATVTPTLFILDRDGILRYKGALDNKEKPGDKNREAYAEDAIEAILAGRPVAVTETQPSGCSIKRKY